MTDASAAGIGWACVNLSTGAVRLGQARWDNEEQYVHSTNGETLGPLIACRHLFPYGTRDHVHVMTDNMATRCAYTKGYSAKLNLNKAMAAMRASFPFMRTSASHVKGTLNPVDGLSRYYTSPEQEMASEEFMRNLRLCLVAVDSDIEVGYGAEDESPLPMHADPTALLRGVEAEGRRSLMVM